MRSLRRHKAIRQGETKKVRKSDKGRVRQVNAPKRKV